MLKLGVLAVQGGFSEHTNAFHLTAKLPEFVDKVQLEVIEVRSAKDLTTDLLGIVLPGGESTTVGRILNKNDFGDKLKDYVAGKLTERPPVVWGTCSGLIMLANNLENQKSGGQYHLGGLDITVSRNFFGRQINSFEAQVDLKSQISERKDFHGVFIRAPAILSCEASDVQTLGTISVCEHDTKPIIVAVQQNNIIGTSFHPELTNDLAWHKHFLHVVLECQKM